jgi:hypothetical protein
MVEKNNKHIKVQKQHYQLMRIQKEKQITLLVNTTQSRKSLIYRQGTRQLTVYKMEGPFILTKSLFSKDYFIFYYKKFCHHFK